MANIIGLDIGGANTKAVFVEINNGALKDVKIEVRYFPIWKCPEKLVDLLSRIRSGFRTAQLGGVGVTMTAELSDAFQTKEEGVKRVLDCVSKAFGDANISVVNVESNLISLDAALSKPSEVAAANWAATGWMVSQLVEDCVVVDVGSTSTSIIPIVAGRIAVNGKNDLEKLINGELVYTGALRTNVAAMVSAVPVKGGNARVSSELFATSGDIHLILGNIKKNEYTVETADGRGKTRFEAMARLSRVVCSDIDMLTESEIFDIAKFIYRCQIEQVTAALRQVFASMSSVSARDPIIVVAGMGQDFIAREAASRAGMKKIVDLGALIRNPLASRASPALGVALMTADMVEGRSIKWTR